MAGTVMAVDVTQVVTGGLITLAGTFVVQVYVIPRVQARTRGRERWEKRVDDLVSLIEETLPRAFDAHRWATRRVHHAREWVVKPELAERVEHFAGFLATAETEARETDKAVGERMADLAVAIRQVRRFNPNAPYWGELDLLYQRLRLAVHGLDVLLEQPDPDRPLDERWQEAWDDVDRWRKSLLIKLNEVASPIPMKPPPQPRWTRLRTRWQRTRRRLQEARLLRRISR